MAWNGVITNAGAELLAQWASGDALAITKATAGTGTASGSLAEQTALTDQRQMASIVNNEAVDSGQKLTIQLTPAAVAYELNQYGIWGTLNGGAETLLAIFQNEQGVEIPGQSSGPDFLYTFYALLNFSSTGGDLTVKVDTSTLVSASQAVRFDVAQALTSAQQAQARTNIGAAASAYGIGTKQDGERIYNGVIAQIGWYRIATASSDASAIIGLHHSYNSTGPSGLTLAANLSAYAGSIRALNFCGRNGSPVVTSARIVQIGKILAVDAFYKIAARNGIAVDVISLSNQKVSPVNFEFVAEDDTLPDGETLICEMDILDPPMVLGFEYRTTERWANLPVYTKLVNCAALPNATTKSVAHGADATQIIRCEGVIRYGGNVPYWTSDTDYCTVHADTTNIILRTASNLSTQTCMVQIWYTKD